MTLTSSLLNFVHDLTAAGGSLFDRLAQTGTRRVPAWRRFVPVRPLPIDLEDPETLPALDDDVRREDRAASHSPVSTSVAARAAADGARAGVLVAILVATWIGARAAFGDPSHPDVAPLTQALGWSDEHFEAARNAAQWAGTAAALATIVASLVAAAAVVGGACGAALTALTAYSRVAVLLPILVAECALWQLTGGHTGPWLRATIWYHLATAVLTLIVVLERTAVVLPQQGSAVPRRWRGASTGRG